MKLIPAIDLKDNKCVRLKKGDESSSRIYNENPLEQAKFFEKSGCERIHLVDLDAAFGRPQINRDTIINIKKSIQIPIQLGGGIRDIKDINFFLKNNIDYLIIGSMAVTNPNLVKEIADKFENKIYIAMDLKKNNEIMIKGWAENSKLTSFDVNEIYKDSKINGYIITNIEKDGMMEGPDENFIKIHINTYNKALIFSGGFSDYESLKFLSRANKSFKAKNKVEGVIIGKAFYSNKIDIKESIKILKSYA